jgi:hypothetical protein
MALRRTSCTRRRPTGTGRSSGTGGDRRRTFASSSGTTCRQSWRPCAAGSRLRRPRTASTSTGMGRPSMRSSSRPEWGGREGPRGAGSCRLPRNACSGGSHAREAVGHRVRRRCSSSRRNGASTAGEGVLSRRGRRRRRERARSGSRRRAFGGLGVVGRAKRAAAPCLPTSTSLPVLASLLSSVGHRRPL